MYLDDHGLIVQKDQDGGDTLRVEGSYACALRWRERLGIPNEKYPKSTAFDYMATIAQLQTEPGVFIRNPYSSVGWHKDPKETSRDQMVPTIIAMGSNQAKDSLWQWTKRFAKRGFVKFQNSDIASPQDWGSLIRAWWDVDQLSTMTYALLLCLLPIVLLGDFQLILSSFVRIWKARDPNDVGDDWNLLALILQAQYAYPTPLSYVSRKVYKRRPQSFGSALEGGSESTIYGALLWYVRPDSGGNREVAEVYHPLIQLM